MPNGSRPDGAGDFALHCRGDVRLYAGEADCTPVSKKGRALLAILAAEQRPLIRTRIIDLLWSDRQEEQARASLRTLLADLKAQFGERFEELLVVDRERVGLASAVRTDLTDPRLARPAGELFEGLDHIDPELDEWLRVEREKWEKQGARSFVAGVAARPSARRDIPRRAWVAILLLALALGALVYFRPWAKPEQPVVAVLKFKDLTGKNALLADGLAEELRIQLAQHPRIQVIGRGSSESEDLQVENSVAAAHENLGATYVVEGSVINRDEQPHLSIRLIDAGDGEQVWTQVLRGEGAMIRAGSAGIAARLAGNINETVGQGSGSAFAADATAYQQVFAARRVLRERNIPDILEAREKLKTIVSRYPRFAPALAVLSELCFLASDHPFVRGPLPLAEARKEAADYARRAIAAAPQFGPGYTALGVAYVETPAALFPFQRAVELNPGSYEAQYRLARALELAGDYQASLTHERAAAALEPLDVTANYQLLRMLRYNGHRNEIPGLVERFVRRTGDPFDKLDFVSGSALETGDLSKGYVAAKEMLRLQPNHQLARRSMMWFLILAGDRSGALSNVSNPDSITAMILREDLPALVGKSRSLGGDFWSLDWETFDASNYLVRRGRSDIVASLYLQTRSKSRGKAPPPSVIDASVIIALRNSGKSTEADRLLREIEGYAQRAKLPPAIAAWTRADMLLLRGRSEEALKLLETTQQDHWWNLQGYVVPLEDRVVYDSVRNHPHFRTIIRTYYANIEREKHELAAELKRFGNSPIDPKKLI